MEKPIFKVLGRSEAAPSTGRAIGYLWPDNWNDWFEYQTLYTLIFFDESGQRHDLGGLKIGQFGWQPKQLRPNLPETFPQLGGQFFSLGQDVSYYSKARALGQANDNSLLRALNDVVADPELLSRARSEDVMASSLMRSVSIRTIQGQFKRVLGGGAALTDYSFAYYAPYRTSDPSDRAQLTFKVIPDSTPPTNVHVLIGRNGVGKSSLLRGMARALTLPERNAHIDGTIESRDLIGISSEEIFANVVSVTFSAFDEFETIPESRSVLGGVSFSSIGLRTPAVSSDGRPITITLDPADLAQEFSGSARSCVVGEKGVRWRRALQTLEADPLFAEAQVSSLAHLDDALFASEAIRLFNALSSGHKIVLLSISKLVEKVEEKSLVLIDEPEAHLHPPLLSAFVRALSDLLTDRNGVAIVATHSPVVLQEVPASCVWKIVRYGAAMRVERPEIETFGENVGVLTSEVFRLEVTRSGFHRMLLEAVSNAGDFDSVLAKFDQAVGSEGRALISSLLATKAQRG